MKVETVTVKNFGAQQTISLPQTLSIDDDKVYVKKEGNVIHLIPFHSPWESLVESLQEFSPDFMEARASLSNRTAHRSTDAVFTRHQYLHLYHQGTAGSYY